VQLTAFLSTMTKSANVLNDVSEHVDAMHISNDFFLQLVDKHLVLTAGGRDDRSMGSRRRGGRQSNMTSEWDRMH
jgi:COP9 signalosome complex subunit 6